MTREQMEAQFASIDLTTRDGVLRLLSDTVRAVIKRDVAATQARAVADIAGVALRELNDANLRARVAELKALLEEDPRG
jgi:hypothetical protein